MVIAAVNYKFIYDARVLARVTLDTTAWLAGDSLQGNFFTSRTQFSRPIGASGIAAALSPSLGREHFTKIARSLTSVAVVVASSGVRPP
jgi:hypothetical protein